MQQLSLSCLPLLFQLRNLCIAFVCLAAFARAQEPVTLELNQPITKSIAGGQTHSYRVTAQADQFLRVVVEQRGADVKLTLFAPDGQKLVEVDSPTGAEGTEAVAAITTAGVYRIEVSVEEKSAKAGRYEARLETLRAATEADRTRVAAARAVAAAEHLADGDAAAKRSALEKYAEALRLWRALDEQRGIAEALTAQGDMHAGLTQYPQAISAYQEALPILRALKDQERESDVLHNLGTVAYTSGDRQQAIEYFNQALALRRARRDARGEASTLNGLAFVYTNLGDRRKAIELHGQALQARRAAKDRRGEAVTLQNLGVLYSALGEKRRAIEQFEEALKLRRALNDAAGQANTLNSLGTVYSDLGDQQRALNAYNESLRLRRDPRDAAVTLVSIGRAYDLLGLPQEALSYYDRALTAFRTAKDRRFEAITLNFIGLAHWSAGDYNAALNDYEQALPIRRELKDAPGEAATLNNQGLAYDSLGDRRKAIEVYNQALPLLRAAGQRQDEAKTLNNLGFAHEALGNTTEALKLHEQALKLSQDVGDRMREAKVHYGIARIERTRGNLKPARNQIEQSIKIVDSLRQKLNSPELRASYRASVQQYYDLYIDVLMRLGKSKAGRAPHSTLIAEALQASEAARARSLVELLTEAGADIRQGVDPALVERERALQEQLNDRTAEQIRLLGARGKGEELAAITKELEQLTADLRDARAEIRRSSPRYAALTQSQPLALADLQKLLDPDTLLVEYWLGEERSYLWAVSAIGLRSFTLPKRATIETAARRYYELLTARNATPPAKETTAARQARIAQADADSRTAGAQLSRLLLSPLAASPGGIRHRRLLVVGEGALNYVPFSSLPEPFVGDGATGRRGDGANAGQGDKETRRQEGTDKQLAPSPRRLVASSPLIVRREVVQLPSATTLAVLRGEREGRKAAPKLAAVFADPVFEAKDERVKVVTIKAPGETTAKQNAEAKPATAAKDAPAATAPATANTPATAPVDPSRILLVKSAKDSGLGGGLLIPRLPNTRREAEAIMALTTPEASKATFDFAANRAAATGDDLSQYRYLHFATHGFLNSLNPELSGLVMALVDEQGRPRNGYLLAPEIYNLKLPATDLVVLSACQTGLGKEVRGEGVVGLTRGFMYAGVPRVVVSLWSVSDQATAELMKTFYAEMLTKEARPAAALRQAQLELLKRKQWQAPYYWAAFGLQGEWR